MSSKKDKLIEEAQNLAMRGLFDKAIKAYEQAMSLDPSALNHRQRLAELLLKAGRTDDARAEFEAIGKYYSSNGFYLKAIAIYKQLHKSFPGDIPILMTLAALNEKHGLIANALTDYRQAFDAYEKSSDMEAAVKVLEKMQTVDPQNADVLLKLAETYFQVKRNDDSYSAFSKSALLLQARGDSAALAQLDGRVRQLFPHKAEFMLEVLSEQVASGNATSAVNALQAMLRINPNDSRVWELIVAAYKKLGQPQKVKVAYQHYLKFFPEEVSAKVGLILCHAEEKNIKGTLALLDTHEADLLLSGNALGDLETVYKALEEIDPINERVLEGLSRIYEAAEKIKERDDLAPKIQSLKNLSGKKTAVRTHSEEQVSSDPDYFNDHSSVAMHFTKESPEVSKDDFNLIQSDNDACDSALDSAFITEPVEQPESTQAELTESSVDFADEFEIEVECDDFDSVETSTTDEKDVLTDVNWLESVGEILESVSTPPLGVKFGGSLDVADAQSHYDLGMAFKEMGLFDEAINEFRQASADPARLLECIVLQGSCLRDKGDIKNADTILRTLLKAELNREESLSAKYELALTCNVAQRYDEFARLLAEIEAASPGYRDVRSLLSTSCTEKNDLVFVEDDLKDFDL